MGKSNFEKKNPQDYIKEVRESDLIKPGDEDIIEKLLKDFSSNNHEITREVLLQKIIECENKVKEELMQQN